MDERFIEDIDVSEENKNDEIEEESIEQENKKQFEILEQVLGKKVKPTWQTQNRFEKVYSLSKFQNESGTEKQN